MPRVPNPGSRVAGSGDPGIVHIIRGEELSGGVSLVCGTYIPAVGAKFLAGMVTDAPATCLWCIAGVARHG